MTTIYFVRHAEPNLDNHDDVSRGLSKKGLQDSKELVKVFEAISIDAFYSSPYRRAIDTISPLAEFRQKEITLIDDLRERKIADSWIEDFSGFSQKQWHDFSYKLEGGESLQEVQGRNITDLEKLLRQHPNQTLVIGTHGTALSTILNYYDSKFDLEAFNRIKHVFPWIVKIQFESLRAREIIEI